MEELLWGRRLLRCEMGKELSEENHEILRLPTMELQKNQITCLRCGTKYHPDEIKISSKNHGSFYYCPACIQLGRVESRLSFYSLPEPVSACRKKIQVAWSGKLTDSQRKISDSLVETIEKKREHLVEAVTGAGKTEMLFECILSSLCKGYRIAIASPRVDVLLELYPRFKAAFPKVEMALLYGKQESPYYYTSFVLCTTHQLLRFFHAFDVLIIDEVDAFPFRNNAVLAYGVENAKKCDAALIYLTATPTKEMRQLIKKKELCQSLLPARYHRHPLVVPKEKWIWQISKKIKNGKIPYAFEKELKEQILNKKRTLIFCSSLVLMEKIFTLVQGRFPDIAVERVSADDQLRKEKVTQMRQGKIDLFFCTTILERGVTFPGIDVFILKADHRVFNEAALIQISGRVGRNAAMPAGRVIFFHSGRSNAMKKAIQHIKKMNQAADEQGLLL